MGALYRVAEFKEKPDRETAEKYLAKGHLCIHMSRKELLMEEIHKNAEEIYLTFMKYGEDARKVYPIIKPASLSEDVLERTDKNAVFPLPITWSDWDPSSWCISLLKRITTETRRIPHS